MKDLCKDAVHDTELKLLERSPEIDEGEAARDPDEFDVEGRREIRESPLITQMGKWARGFPGCSGVVDRFPFAAQ